MSKRIITKIEDVKVGDKVAMNRKVETITGVNISDNGEVATLEYMTVAPWGASKGTFIGLVGFVTVKVVID